MPVGTCHLCGETTSLTFEHVPPKAAFNNRPVVRAPLESLIKAQGLDGLDSIRGPQNQRGAGAYTLCGPCNNNTGKWYGPAYVDWAYQGLYALDHAQIAPSILFIFRVFPLRVIKQILCMFLSANPPGVGKHNHELARFVLNRQHKWLPTWIRIYVALTNSKRSRQAGLTGNLELGRGKMRLFSEISFPPFTYVMTHESEPPDQRLVDISHFGERGFQEWVDVPLALPILPVYTFFPGDYRDSAHVKRDYVANTTKTPL